MIISNNKSSLHILEQYITTFLFVKHGPRQDSYSEILKFLLPEIIVEYFELTTYEKWKKYFLFT
jgi:hypothetical protein